LRQILVHIGEDTEPLHIFTAHDSPLWDDCDAQAALMTQTRAILSLMWLNFLSSSFAIAENIRMITTA
jgi:hypothetical protein